MTNEQFDTLNGHLGSMALSLKEIAQLLKDRPAPVAGSGSSPSSSSHTGWRAHRIHFGKQRDERLGDISEKSLGWWIENYHPKPFFTQNGEERPPGKNDVALRKALDEAAAEGGNRSETQAPASSGAPAEAPRSLPPPRPAPAPQQDINDEDVPF